MKTILLQNPRNAKTQSAEVLLNHFGPKQHGFRFRDEPWIYNVVEVYVPPFIIEHLNRMETH